jgi:hypothetical protein
MRTGSAAEGQRLSLFAERENRSLEIDDALKTNNNSESDYARNQSPRVHAAWTLGNVIIGTMVTMQH